MFSSGYLGREFLGGESPCLSNLSLTGEAIRLAAIGERGLLYGDGSLFTGSGDLGRPTGDLENRRALGGGVLARVSRRGEYPRCGDLGLPL